MSRKKGQGPARIQRGMPRASDLRDGVTGAALKNVAPPNQVISHGYRGKARHQGKTHAPHPRDLWSLEVDTWMRWDCADCGTTIARGTQHHRHRQTGSRRCTDCQSFTYPE